MISSGILEVISISAIIPFLAVITNTGNFQNNWFIKELIFNNFSIESNNFPLLFSLLFAFTALIAGIIRLLNYWLNARLSALITSDFSVMGFNNTLNQPYETFLNKNSSALIIAAAKQYEVLGEVIRSILQFLTGFFISIFLIFGILITNWKITFYFVIIFSFFYFLIVNFVSKKLFRNSKVIAKSAFDLVKIVQESIGSIRDIILDKSQKNFLNEYKSIDYLNRINTADNYFFRVFPRYALETLGLIIIAITAGILITFSVGTNLLPTLGFVALAAQKLLPTFQAMYSSWAFIKGTESEQAAILNILNLKTSKIITSKDKLFFNREIKLQSVNFKYEKSKQLIIKSLNLNIKKGERIGLVGKTGSGKSTLIDIIMGLLEPNSGKLLIDNIDLHKTPNSENLYRWRDLIAHVPQNIFLKDATIAENIALGYKYEEIDFKKLSYVCNQAQLNHYIDSCPIGYKEIVGERGIRLSGGQRQRIAIARALYKDKKILVFDEATSALDSKTEIGILNSLDLLSRDLTLILIAHRLSTLKSCDRIFKLENGKLDLY
tara:strand:+ start:15428 stop:17077 length:1650 start_codon:yes stop_codon:yes gene_type:complete